MRVLLINTSEQIGGAAIAASRLMDALKSHGVKAKLLVRDKQSDKINVIRLDRNWLAVWNFVWERVVIWIANRFKKDNIFAVDIANVGADITTLPEFKQADVIHLHWINQGMLSLKGIRKILESGKPVVWTLHDMWPLTGICHHARTCENYKTECKHCQFLKSAGKRDLSTRTFLKKKKIYSDFQNNIRFVAVSHWQRNRLETSALLGNRIINVIPNALLTGSFNKYNRQACRRELNLPSNKYILAFGASRMDDSIKGFPHLVAAIRHLNAKGVIKFDNIHLVLFGRVKNETAFFASIPVEYTWFGTVNDTRMLSKLYSAADVFAMPSLYETFGQTLIESMACGCVPIAFDNSGPAEIIDHLHNGYVAEFLSVEDLANGINWILSEADYSILSEQAMHKVTTRYSEQVVARQYIDIYNQITGNHE
ncbi:glycosyltransferase [Bacteroides sp. OttesenSCG-928-D19]|nr:glycosyltransferase [Bacteroides sp. OttesenSCG-928-N06]MDL2304095.1 glycosyltransferase [Bacteroides sp. OttesenSCG-928-D19]